MRHAVKWGLRFALAAAALLIVLGFVVPFFLPWTELNCRHQDVDIRTGRLRYMKYFLFLKVSDRVEDSSITSLLSPEQLTGAADWRRVNTFSPGVHYSPHYTFHGAIGDMRTLSMIWEMDNAPEDVRRKTALHVLALWQYAGHDFLAGRYLSALDDLDDRDKRPALIASILRLAMPDVREEGGVVTRTVFYPNSQPMDRIHGRIDAAGRFVKDGAWESWYRDGKRELYAQYVNGEMHGRRFNWNHDGKLGSIEGFAHDTLTEYETENLDRHPDYKVAEQLNPPGPPTAEKP